MTKVILSKNKIDTIMIQLVDLAGGEVIMKKHLTVWEMRAMDHTQSEFEIWIQTLLHAIVGWNFVDEDDKPLPVTMENLNMVSMNDMKILMEALQKTNKIETPEESKKE